MLELSLYTIESDLVNLIEMRESALEESNGILAIAGPESSDYADCLHDVEVIDQQIREYLTAEIRKVDNVRSFWKHAELMERAAKDEAKAQSERAKQWGDRLTRLKAMCKEVMEGLVFPDGKPRKLEGRTGALYLKANGGRQAVMILQPELVPDEFCAITVTMPLEVWNIIQRDQLPGCAGKAGARMPSLSLISAAIDRGEGVPGCDLAFRGNHVECK